YCPGPPMRSARRIRSSCESSSPQAGISRFVATRAPLHLRAQTGPAIAFTRRGRSDLNRYLLIAPEEKACLFSNRSGRHALRTHHPKIPVRFVHDRSLVGAPLRAIDLDRASAISLPLPDRSRL